MIVTTRVRTPNPTRALCLRGGEISDLFTVEVCFLRIKCAVA